MKTLFSTHLMLLFCCGITNSCGPSPVEQSAEAAPPMDVEAPAITPQAMIDRGKYLVTVGLCNDCHTPKIFTETGMHEDETRLLAGHPSDEVFSGVDPNIQLEGRAVSNEHFTAWAGPWGTSFSANLTPDATGIGNWPEENFIRALREGKFKGLEGSRDLLPPMPWPSLGQMTDEDLKAIFAYLKSIKPVRNVVPPPLPPPAAG